MRILEVRLLFMARLTFDVRLTVIGFHLRFAVLAYSSSDVVASFLDRPEIGSNNHSISARLEHEARAVRVVVFAAGEHSALRARRTRRLIQPLIWGLFIVFQHINEYIFAHGLRASFRGGSTQRPAY